MTSWYCNGESFSQPLTVNSLTLEPKSGSLRLLHCVFGCCCRRSFASKSRFLTPPDAWNLGLPLLNSERSLKRCPSQWLSNGCQPVVLVPLARKVRMPLMKSQAPKGGWTRFFSGQKKDKVPTICYEYGHFWGFFHQVWVNSPMKHQIFKNFFHTFSESCFKSESLVIYIDWFERLSKLNRDT